MTDDNEQQLNQSWQPSIGPETKGFLEKVVPEESRKSVLDSSIKILARGVSPTEYIGQETGLVVGYVQSGKTMSFETVIALARDNKFQIIIVIAGTSNALLNQSTGRIRNDLGVDNSNRTQIWLPLINPENESDLRILRDAIAIWQDSNIHDNCKRTVVITVLKHHSRLKNLTDLIRQINMDRIPVLIVDDEADQASLNNEVNQEDESTTYERLMELRGSFPLHTYLQYTATPQAPLLVSIADSLSPNYVEVLTPGENYVGGKDFFASDGGQDLVRIIPVSDVPNQENQLNEPPQTLEEALRFFVVGITVNFFQSNTEGNRSMLIHPSHGTVLHQRYRVWTTDILDEWKRIINLSDHDPDRKELLEEYRTTYDDLSNTVKKIPTFDEIIPYLSLSLRRIRVIEVNTRESSTPEVDWPSEYGWILIGGQAMDRGFTVNGLTVTYMPRGIGVGNADTVQQRARFFGYKRDYLGFCRVYLEESTYDAFTKYVEHEEDIRGQLENIQSGESSLNEWKRAFVLDPNLKPCRQSVIEFDYTRSYLSNKWIIPRTVQATEAVLYENRQTALGFIQSTSFQDDHGHAQRTDFQRHYVATGLSLSNVMTQLLIPMRLTGSHDSRQFFGLLLQLSRALESNPDETCAVYQMSPKRERDRSINKSGEIATNLFQGAHPSSPRELQGKIYPGDHGIRIDRQVTVQIHTINLVRDNEVVSKNVPVLAVWIPKHMADYLVIQSQPDQTI